MEALKKLQQYAGPEGPVVLVIMDGIGVGEFADGDMVQRANTPVLDWMKDNAIYTELKAHGKAVGLPSDADMGNSEVGHNAIGCGRVFEQGAALVNKAIETGAMFEGDTWKNLVANAKSNDSSMHFIGLFSDGNVHSNIAHLKAMLAQAKAEGVKTLRVHPLIDGRDVPPTSALEYVEPFEAFLAELNADGSVDACIASGGGRMNITMDRYGADWSMVDRGWKTHVKGEGSLYPSTTEAIKAMRAATPGILDQDLPPFVIERDGKAVGPIVDGDSVVFFNFRGDRSIEISLAFDEEEMPNFDRGEKPNVAYAGMMEYDGDAHYPKNYLVTPPAIDRTMGEYLCNSGIAQMAISETQKYGHVTYFFNGNRAGMFDENLEEYIEIPSDILPFEQRPWMQGAQITDEVIDAIETGNFPFIRLNYPNGDMVGHTGVDDAVEIAVESVDLCLARLKKVIDAAGGIMVITADHGNADDMHEHKKDGNVKMDAETGKMVSKTSHSLNPVPCIIYDPANVANASLSAAAKDGGLGISSLAATCMNLLGFEAPEDYDASCVDVG